MAEIDELRRTQLFGRLNSSGMVSLQNRDVRLFPMDDSSLEELHCNIVLMLGNVISSFPSSSLQFLPCVPFPLFNCFRVFYECDFEDRLPEALAMLLTEITLPMSTLP